MNRIVVCGTGVVSPAGWGLAPFRAALSENRALPRQSAERSRGSRPSLVQSVPPPAPSSISHGRLRRSSPISRFATAAVLEALGGIAPALSPTSETSHFSKSERLGIILCVMAGCVNYTRRFYAETLRDSATASPLVFPETVFNAPASHIASLLGVTSLNYTLVGDPGTFLVGVALAAHWLAENLVDGCVVVGAEELDWLTSEATSLFSSDVVVSEGAGALYLKNGQASDAKAVLECVSDPSLFTTSCDRGQAARTVRNELPPFCPTHLLCDSRIGHPRIDRAENTAWNDWKGARLSPKIVLGESLAASGAWQCAAVVDALASRQFSAASVSIVGCNQQAIAAHFAAV